MYIESHSERCSSFSLQVSYSRCKLSTSSFNSSEIKEVDNGTKNGCTFHTIEVRIQLIWQKLLQAHYKHNDHFYRGVLNPHIIQLHRSVHNQISCRNTNVCRWISCGRWTVTILSLTDAKRSQLRNQGGF